MHSLCGEMLDPLPHIAYASSSDMQLLVFKIRPTNVVFAAMAASVNALVADAENVLTEDQIQARIQKRVKIIVEIITSELFKELNVQNLRALVVPDACDRAISKRAWEHMVQQMRAGIRNSIIKQRKDLAVIARGGVVDGGSVASTKGLWDLESAADIE